jgi:hypothetical protein
VMLNFHGKPENKISQHDTFSLWKLQCHAYFSQKTRKGNQSAWHVFFVKASMSCLFFTENQKRKSVSMLCFPCRSLLFTEQQKRKSVSMVCFPCRSLLFTEQQKRKSVSTTCFPCRSLIFHGTEKKISQHDMFSL